MKAIVYEKYGPPEVLQIQEVIKPVPKPNEVLIRIFATTVNRTDCGFRKAEYIIIRIINGFFTPKNKILGSEFAGVIESIGTEVKKFNVGDQVFGLSTYTFGTHAEYICIDEKKSIAIKPINMQFEEAASICDGAFLAYAMMQKIDFKNNPKILINGASGSIGIAAVQLANYFGGEITVVCKTKNFDLMRSLGATHFVDYTKDDFTKMQRQFDVILDVVGKSSFFKCKKILKPKSIYISSELGYLSQNIFLALFTPFLGGKKVLFPIPKDNQKDIHFFKELIEAEKYLAVIDRTYSLDQIIEATRYVETGEKVGNVVIKVAH